MEANLVAAFKLISGRGSLALDLPDKSSVRDALMKITQKNLSLKKNWMDGKGNLLPHVHIFLNGDDVTTLPDGVDTPLADIDILDFIPPLSGG